MKRLVVATMLCLGVSAVARGAAPGEVVREFACPCEHPAGMVSDGTDLYITDWRAAQIHQVRVPNGEVLRSFAAPTLRPHGLAWGAGTLYVSDSQSGWVYALNPETGVVENSFEAPGSAPTGLAWADGVLYLLEAASRKIYKVLPEDGTILAYFDAPTPSSTCLTWDGKHLWASDRSQNELYRISPEHERVIGILNAPGPYAAGLASLEGHLWNVDFQTRKVYQLALAGEQAYYLYEPRRARVEFVWTLYNYGPGELRDVAVNVALPPTLPQQKLLSEPQLPEEPAEFATDQWEQRAALYRLATVPAGTRRELGFKVDAEVSSIRYIIDPEAVGRLSDVPREIREAYTADGSRYRIDSPFVQETVMKIVGVEQNPYWIARKIYDHLIAKLEYQMVGGWDVPEVVLKRGAGSCSEYTFAFIALCRAAGVPARYQGSVVVRGDDASVDEPHHRWAEVYLPKVGWIPVDANRGDKPLPADQCRGFGELANKFLITTQSGGDSEYLAWTYNAHVTYKATGYSKVEQQTLGIWRPLEEGGGRAASDATSGAKCSVD